MLDVPKRVLAVSRGGTNATRRIAAGWLFMLLAIASAPIALQPVYAQSYPERTIKIVVPFSAGGPTDVVIEPNIVRAVAALANGLGMKTTAEGVETKEQLDKITSEGCTEMQGFLFSHPLPAREIERLFLSRREKPRDRDGIVAA